MTLRGMTAAAAIFLAMGTPASADDFGQWGLWGNPHAARKSVKATAAAASKLDSKQATKLAAAGKTAAAVNAKAAKRAPAKPVELAMGGAKPAISPQAPSMVKFDAGFAANAVIIDTAARKLYYTLPNGNAFVYPVAVGKEGFTWSGTEAVSKVVDWPEWVPPEEMRQRKPYLPLRMTGGLDNPLGAKAIYLGTSLYRIHGTNEPKSIGKAASSGCIRMLNAHVVHLANLVEQGTSVHVVSTLPSTAATAPLPVKTGDNG